jgi:hypothetical protein
MTLVARIRDLGKDLVLEVVGPNDVLDAKKVKGLRVPYDPLNPDNKLMVGVYSHSFDEKSDQVAITFLVSGKKESEELVGILSEELGTTIDYIGLAS